MLKYTRNEHGRVKREAETEEEKSARREMRNKNDGGIDLVGELSTNARKKVDDRAKRAAESEDEKRERRDKRDRARKRAKRVAENEKREKRY